jgi:hypothetical protein
MFLYKTLINLAPGSLGVHLHLKYIKYILQLCLIFKVTKGLNHLFKLSSINGHLIP